MARSQRKYDHEYKVQAVKLAKEIGGAKAAKELGIPEGTIHEKFLKAEYLLPIYIDELLQSRKVRVKVLDSHDKWFGVTYKEDKESVMEAFRKLIKKGVYKEELFSDL